MDERGRRLELLLHLAGLLLDDLPPQPALLLRRWRLDDGGGTFSVEDNGIGIEAQHIPRLTERFYRVDQSRSRESGGTGLGLAIVKHVIQRHGGELRIASTLGKGSRFSLLFPSNRVRDLPEPA